MFLVSYSHCSSYSHYGDCLALFYACNNTIVSTPPYSRSASVDRQNDYLCTKYVHIGVSLSAVALLQTHCLPAFSLYKFL